MAGEAAAIACPSCGTHLAPALLACPACARLVYAEELKALAARAQTARDPADALAAWREAIVLLPEGTRQHEQIARTIDVLRARVDAPEKPADSGAWGKRLAGMGAVGLFLWKFKAVIAFVLTKGKLLLMGLTKASTFFSMLLSLGLYWTLWGWKFALGFVLSIYVHEMGHVAALRKAGLPASAPMFIPGLGAFVRLKARPVDVHEDARIGLAGPIWGLGAALFCWLAFLSTGAPLMAALAKTGAWINLFNLLPLGSLDGGRGFVAMTRTERWIAVGGVALALLLSGEGLLVLLLLAAVARAFMKSESTGDRGALVTYVGLVAALAWLTTLPVPGATR